MRIFPLGFAFTALSASLLSVACASSGTVPVASRTTFRPTQSESLKELEAIYRARKDSALVHVSPADVEFISGMIGHHAQALVMSAFAPDNDANRTIQILAARITNAQTDEIALMQRWLRDRGRDVPEVGPGGHMVHDAGPDPLMPGMLSPEKLTRLARARGMEFDRLFLTYMIEHHRGAVTMVHALFAKDGAAQDNLIFKLASDIQVDQITEVARMRQMLDALVVGPER